MTVCCLLAVPAVSPPLCAPAPCRWRQSQRSSRMADRDRLPSRNVNGAPASASCVAAGGVEAGVPGPSAVPLPTSVDLRLSRGSGASGASATRRASALSASSRATNSGRPRPRRIPRERSVLPSMTTSVRASRGSAVEMEQRDKDSGVGSSLQSPRSQTGSQAGPGGSPSATAATAAAASKGLLGDDTSISCTYRSTVRHAALGRASQVRSPPATTAARPTSIPSPPASWARQDYTSEHRSRAPSPERKGTVSAAPSKRSVPSVERTPAVYARSGAVPATADEIEGEGPRPYRGILASETSMSCSSRPPDPAGTTAATRRSKAEPESKPPTAPRAPRAPDDEEKSMTDPRRAAASPELVQRMSKHILRAETSMVSCNSVHVSHGGDLAAPSGVPVSVRGRAKGLFGDDTSATCHQVAPAAESVHNPVGAVMAESLPADVASLLGSESSAENQAYRVESADAVGAAGTNTTMSADKDRARTFLNTPASEEVRQRVSQARTDLLEAVSTHSEQVKDSESEHTIGDTPAVVPPSSQHGAALGGDLDATRGRGDSGQCLGSLSNKDEREDRGVKIGVVDIEQTVCLDRDQTDEDDIVPFFEATESPQSEANILASEPLPEAIEAADDDTRLTAIAGDEAAPPALPDAPQPRPIGGSCLPAPRVVGSRGDLQTASDIHAKERTQEYDAVEVQRESSQGEVRFQAIKHDATPVTAKNQGLGKEDFGADPTRAEDDFSTESAENPAELELPAIVTKVPPPLSTSARADDAPDDSDFQTGDEGGATDVEEEEEELGVGEEGVREVTRAGESNYATADEEGEDGSDLEGGSDEESTALAKAVIPLRNECVKGVFPQGTTGPINISLKTVPVKEGYSPLQEGVTDAPGVKTHGGRAKRTDDLSPSEDMQAMADENGDVEDDAEVAQALAPDIPDTNTSMEAEDIVDLPLTDIRDAVIEDTDSGRGDSLTDATEAEDEQDIAREQTHPSSPDTESPLNVAEPKSAQVDVPTSVVPEEDTVGTVPKSTPYLSECVRRIASRPDENADTVIKTGGQGLLDDQFEPAEGEVIQSESGESRPREQLALATLPDEPCEGVVARQDMQDMPLEKVEDFAPEEDSDVQHLAPPREAEVPPGAGDVVPDVMPHSENTSFSETKESATKLASEEESTEKIKSQKNFSEETPVLELEAEKNPIGSEPAENVQKQEETSAKDSPTANLKVTPLGVGSKGQTSVSGSSRQTSLMVPPPDAAELASPPPEPSRPDLGEVALHVPQVLVDGKQMTAAQSECLGGRRLADAGLTSTKQNKDSEDAAFACEEVDCPKPPDDADSIDEKSSERGKGGGEAAGGAQIMAVECPKPPDDAESTVESLGVTRAVDAEAAGGTQTMVVECPKPPDDAESAGENSSLETLAEALGVHLLVECAQAPKEFMQGSNKTASAEAAGLQAARSECLRERPGPSTGDTQYAVGRKDTPFPPLAVIEGAPKARVGLAVEEVPEERLSALSPAAADEAREAVGRVDDAVSKQRVAPDAAASAIDPGLLGRAGGLSAGLQDVADVTTAAVSPAELSDEPPRQWPTASTFCTCEDEAASRRANREKTPIRSASRPGDRMRRCSNCGEEWTSVLSGLDAAARRRAVLARAMAACERELGPLNDSLRRLHDRVRALDLPELEPRRARRSASQDSAASASVGLGLQQTRSSTAVVGRAGAEAAEGTPCPYCGLQLVPEAALSPLARMYILLSQRRDPLGNSGSGPPAPPATAEPSDADADADHS